MSIVKHRDTYYVTTQLDGSGRFSANININKMGDEIRIIQVVYVPDTQDNNFDEGGNAAVGDANKFLSGNSLFRLGWDGVAECMFLFDIEHTDSNLNIRLNTHGRDLQGRQSFTIYNHLGAVDRFLNGRFGFVFESVKY